MKRVKWALFLVFAILCFTGGILVDRALIDSSDTAEKTGESEEENRPICKNVLRPNFVLPASGMFLNDQPVEPISRSRAEELFAQALETTNFQKRAELLRQVAVGIPEEHCQDSYPWPNGL